MTYSAEELRAMADIIDSEDFGDQKASAMLRYAADVIERQEQADIRPSFRAEVAMIPAQRLEELLAQWSWVNNANCIFVRPQDRKGESLCVHELRALIAAAQRVDRHDCEVWQNEGRCCAKCNSLVNGLVGQVETLTQERDTLKRERDEAREIARRWHHPAHVDATVIASWGAPT